MWNQEPLTAHYDVGHSLSIKIKYSAVCNLYFFFAKGFKVLLPATTSRKCAHGCTELVRMDFNIQSGILKFRTPSLMNPFGVLDESFRPPKRGFLQGKLVDIRIANRRIRSLPLIKHGAAASISSAEDVVSVVSSR